MRQTVLVLSLTLVLAGCSNHLCVEVDAVPPIGPGGQATAGPVDRLGSFSVATRFLDPQLGTLASRENLVNAGILAATLTGGPGAGSLAQGIATMLQDPNATASPAALGAAILEQQTGLADHQRALAELGLRVATDLGSGRPDAVAVATTSLLEGFVSRQDRIYGGTGGPAGSATGGGTTGGGTTGGPATDVVVTSLPAPTTSPRPAPVPASGRLEAVRPRPAASPVPNAPAGGLPPPRVSAPGCAPAVANAARPAPAPRPVADHGLPPPVVVERCAADGPARR